MTKLKLIALLTGTAAAAILAGCSGQSANLAIDEEIRVRDERIATLEKQMNDQQQQLTSSRTEAELAEARAREAASRFETYKQDMDNTRVEGSLLPPAAEAGECYARVLVPPVYETTSERVLVKEASERIEIAPATFEWAEEKILVKEASERLEVVPAVYETVTERHLVKPAFKEMRDVPAVYETVTEEILVTPARKYWKRGRGLIEKVDGNTGEIMCLVEEPAVYETVTRKVLKEKATTREVEVPAEYKTVTKQVVKTPATTRTVTIPAEYDVVKVRRQVTPATEKRIPVAAEYRTVAKQSMSQPSRLEWRRVVCETNLNGATVLGIQKALAARGFDPGPLDGVYGSRTQAAVGKFQEANNMSKGGLTFETIRALGVTSGR